MWGRWPFVSAELAGWLELAGQEATRNSNPAVNKNSFATKTQRCRGFAAEPACRKQRSSVAMNKSAGLRAGMDRLGGRRCAGWQNLETESPI